MRITLDSEGLSERDLTAWTAGQKARIRAGVLKGMRAEAPAVTKAMRAQVVSKLKVTKKNFLNAYKHKIYDAKKDELPDLRFYSGVPFSARLDTGGVVRAASGKKLLIPLTSGGTRISVKRLRLLVRKLLASKTGFFRKVGQRTLLFANYDASVAGGLAPARRRLMPGKGFRLQSGSAIPVAMIVPQVTLKKAARVAPLVIRRLGSVANAIQKELQ